MAGFNLQAGGWYTTGVLGRDARSLELTLKKVDSNAGVRRHQKRHFESIWLVVEPNGLMHAGMPTLGCSCAMAIFLIPIAPDMALDIQKALRECSWRVNMKLWGALVSRESASAHTAGPGRELLPWPRDQPAFTNYQHLPISCCNIKLCDWK